MGEDWNKIGCTACDKGVPVYAVSNGIVKYADFPNTAYGNLVLIQHDVRQEIKFSLPGGGSTSTVWSLYEHMATISNNPRTGQKWKKGNIIYRGEQVGTIGDAPTDSNTNYHLHFEIRQTDLTATSFDCKLYKPTYVDNNYLNPTAFIKLNRPENP